MTFLIGGKRVDYSKMVLRQLANLLEKWFSSIFISHLTSKQIPDEKFKHEHETIEVLEGNKNKYLHNFPVGKDFLSITERTYHEGKFEWFEYIFFNSLNLPPSKKSKGKQKTC